MNEILSFDFFNKPTLQVAESLIGAYLCKKSEDEHLIVKRMITEVEAYDGFEDKASHAHRGKTPRNSIMFGGAGYWYVYLCYGVHKLLNIVTGPADYPAAVLIRGVKEISGPGRLTKAMNIDLSFNRLECSALNGLWIESGEPISRCDIKTTPRIGIDYAGPEWKEKPWRFLLDDIIQK